MSLEVNKALSAVLVAGISFMIAGFIGDTLVKPERLHEPAIKVPEIAAPSAGPAAAPETIDPVVPLLAAANADNGKVLAQRQCGACHKFDPGGPNGVGPNLAGVVGRNHASHEGFNYSAAMKGKAGEPWSYEAINTFIAGPAKAIPGTRMTYGGLRQAGQRADVVAYLRSISPEAPAP